MILNSNGVDYAATPENSVVISCDNDMLNGFFVDYPETYLFIPDDTEGYPELAIGAVDEGIPVVDVQNPDLEQTPFKWIVNALGRACVAKAEEFISECE